MKAGFKKFIALFVPKEPAFAAFTDEGAERVEAVVSRAETAREHPLYKESAVVFEETMQQLLSELPDRSDLTTSIKKIQTDTQKRLEKDGLEEVPSMTALQSIGAKGMARAAEELDSSSSRAMSAEGVSLMYENALKDVRLAVNAHLGARAQQNIGADTHDRTSAALSGLASAGRNAGDGLKVATLGVLASPAAPAAPAVALSGALVSGIAGLPKTIHDTSTAIGSGDFVAPLTNTLRGVAHKVGGILPESVRESIDKSLRDTAVRHEREASSEYEPLLVSGNLHEGLSTATSLGVDAASKALQLAEVADPTGVAATVGLAKSAVSRALDSRVEGHYSADAARMHESDASMYINPERIMHIVDNGILKLDVLRVNPVEYEQRKDKDLRLLIGEDVILTEAERPGVVAALREHAPRVAATSLESGLSGGRGDSPVTVTASASPSVVARPSTPAVGV